MNYFDFHCNKTFFIDILFDLCSKRYDVVWHPITFWRHHLQLCQFQHTNETEARTHIKLDVCKNIARNMKSSANIITNIMIIRKMM